MNQLIGFGAGRSPTDVIYKTTLSDATDLSTYTFAGVNIDVAAASRRVVVGLLHVPLTGSLSSCTIGGITATTLVQNLTSSTYDLLLLIAIVPTGTTADIVFNFSGTQDICQAFVWSVYGLESSTPVDTKDSNGSPATLSLITHDGGAVIGIAHQNGGTAPAWSGITLDTGASQRNGASADNVQASSSRTITVTHDGGTEFTGLTISLR